MQARFNSPKLPPVGIIKLIEKIRNFLNKSAKKMIPANFALLEMSLNFFIAKAIYGSIFNYFPNQWHFEYRQKPLRGSLA